MMFGPAFHGQPADRGDRPAVRQVPPRAQPGLNVQVPFDRHDRRPAQPARPAARRQGRDQDRGQRVRRTSSSPCSTHVLPREDLRGLLPAGPTPPRRSPPFVFDVVRAGCRDQARRPVREEGRDRRRRQERAVPRHGRLRLRHRQGAGDRHRPRPEGQGGDERDQRRAADARGGDGEGRGGPDPQGQGGRGRGPEQGPAGQGHRRPAAGHRRWPARVGRRVPEERPRPAARRT